MTNNIDPDPLTNNTISQINEYKERGVIPMEIGERRVDDEIFKNGNWHKQGDNPTTVLASVFRLIKKLFRIKSAATFEESVSELIREHHTDESVHEEEKAILQNIITFGDLEADDVMITRTDIIAAPEDVPLKELENLFVKYSHSRIPIYRESIDNIVGFIHLKDLFKNIIIKEDLKAKDILREVIYVPTTIKITDLLSRMKHSSVHIAIVLDEYGGTDGLVTIEDIVRRVLGEIRDDYPAENQSNTLIRILDDGFVVDAKTKIEEVNKALKLDLSTNNADYDTFGGFIITFLGRIPKKGEVIKHPSGLCLEIMDASNRKISMVKVLQSTNAKFH